MDHFDFNRRKEDRGVVFALVFFAVAACLLYSLHAYAGEDLRHLSKGDVWAALVEILAPLLAGFAGWVAYRIQAWVATKTKNEAVLGLTAYLNDAVGTAVRAAAQTSVKAIRRKGLGLSAAEGRAIALETLLAVKCQLGDRGLADLQKALRMPPESVDHLIASKIEAAVFGIKQETKVEATVTR